MTVGVAALVVGAVALRLPAFLAGRALVFDDGVYGASAVAMRSGALPFREVFSSQGPLFLPLVWLADVAGFRTLDAPRLLAVAAGAALVALTFFCGRRLGLSDGACLLAAGLVATSGSVAWVTAPLTADGPALALATAAVLAALRLRDAPSFGRAFVLGVLLGATLSVKALLVAVVVPIVMVMGRRDRRALATVFGTAGVLAFVVAVPWGLANVWDQAFRYHLQAAGPRTPGHNLAKVVATLGERDPGLLLVAGVLGGAFVALRFPWRNKEVRPVIAWLAATVLVLAAEHPLWRNHVSQLIPPLALLVAAGADAAWTRLASPTRDGPVAPGARRRPGARVGGLVAGTAALAVAVVALQTVRLGDLLHPAPPEPGLALTGDDLRLLPPGALVISDDPGAVWRAGRATPPDFVDTSILQMQSGRMTRASVLAAARRPRVCAVMILTDRFSDLFAPSGAGPALSGFGYDVVDRLGDVEHPPPTGSHIAGRWTGAHGLWVKTACARRLESEAHRREDSVTSTTAPGSRPPPGGTPPAPFPSVPRPSPRRG